MMMLLDAILIHTYAYAMRPDASIGIPDPHHNVDMAPDKAKGPGTATTKKAKLTWLMGEIKDEDLSTIEVLPPRSCMTSHVTSSALHAAAS
jgi:hypothetical protein